MGYVKTGHAIGSLRGYPGEAARMGTPSYTIVTQPPQKSPAGLSGRSGITQIHRCGIIFAIESPRSASFIKSSRKVLASADGAGPVQPAFRRVLLAGHFPIAFHLASDGRGAPLYK